MSEAQQTRPKVLAAIPCFNTEPFIADVVSNAKKYVDQVVVINDGSHDGTAEAARTAGALVISHEVNRGAGEATKSCFEAAKANAADVLVTLDGDRQHNPDEVPLLIAPIIKGEADLVIGSRFLGDHSSMPKYRKFGIAAITFLYNLGSKTRVSDAQSCFRAYSRKALNSLSITEKGFGFSVQLLIEAERRGLVITEVPISCIYHSASHTLNPVVHGLSVALSVVRIRLKNSLQDRSEKAPDFSRGDESPY
ncbi:glycosyltransferase family 2 protein [Dehalococcoidia bacterium]|nr:glycosyltransferase family 2 protein [Dehalococcoidia bacterium]